MPDEMPSDPFREGQLDWGWLAGNDVSFFAAHIAAGMAENVALELTRTYLQFLLGVMLAGSVQQNPEQQQPGEACD